jgi:hypothetical protein
VKRKYLLSEFYQSCIVAKTRHDLALRQEAVAC